MKLSNKCIEELKSEIVKEIMHYSTLNFFYRAQNLYNSVEYTEKLIYLVEQFEKVCNLDDKNSPISNKAN